MSLNHVHLKDLFSSDISISDHWNLNDGYAIARVSRLPESLYLKQFNEHLVQGFPVLPWRSTLSNEDREKLGQLQALTSSKFQIKLALIHEGAMVGWSYGWQETGASGDFYMAGSLVLPEHRNKGLYTSLVHKIVDIAKTEGFTAIRSRHICTNNPVIIAKLKIGFMINGFEQDEVMGTLVRMTYHLNPLRKRAALYRAGKVDEAEVVAKLFSDPISRTTTEREN